MKTVNKPIFWLALGLVALSSCNDFLDREPLDRVTPDNFLWTEDDLASYAVKHYDFPSHAERYDIGRWAEDNHTDNQATASYDDRWIPGQWRVSESIKEDDDPWNFKKIRAANYFLEIVVPRFNAGELQGNETNIKHYIGEVYLERAWDYFKRLEKFGDFPIVRSTLPDEKNVLIEASKRQPQNEVARFIISDLDSAIMLLSNSIPGGKNRITRNVALLIKSRVALYEASWLTYHKGTNRVPGGPGWPGGSSDIHIDQEIAYFLGECKKAASELADQGLLADNNGQRGMDNPYFAQFSLESMEGCPEILMWRQYNKDEFNIKHGATSYITTGGNTGFTRQFVETFLCSDGKPVYASPDYKGDASIDKVRENRESRLDLFMMKPNEKLDEEPTNGHTWPEAPLILDINEVKSVTGYGLRKGLAAATYHKGGDQTSIEGCPVFRAAEAYLNYIEASCMENGGNSIDGKAIQYWKAIRDRAKLPDYSVTVAATDLSKESDWGVYSAGQPVSPLLYCIRRERRCEMVEEGLRMMDLRRWRALDQVKNYQVEGVNLWESNLKDAYKDKAGKNLLIEQGNESSNVSSYAESGKYLRPYQIAKKNNLMWDGYNWCDAHYFTPIAINHFRITASNADDLTTSTLYQNPGWPLEANGAIGY
ncbi:MAG: RagB/SusD family nutrient uptake outer membrane protein [Parabacteroides sp.]|nr:RagB/SusD family nutrient uptake outer membrane protein [Parabacteroides sp.]